MLPQENIHYLRLFTRLIGELPTDVHSKEELATLADRYLMNRTIGVVTYDTPDKSDVRTMLIAQWTALDEDLAAGYELMKEMLFHTQFTDVQALSEQISAQKTFVRNQINKNPYIALYARQEGIGDPKCRYYDYLNYTSYYAFLEDLEIRIAENPDEVLARLQNVQSFLANRSGAIAAFAGNEKSIALNAPLVDDFFAGMPLEAREYPVYNLPVPQLREAIAVDGNIQYNCAAASFSQIGAEPDYALSVIGQLIVDKLLMPILRDQMGAYTLFCGMDDNTALYLISYRDTNIKATFDVYDSIPEKLAGFDLTQAELDGYILNCYSVLAKPGGELSDATAEIERIIQERPADEKLQIMRAYKSVTPETVRASAEVFTLLAEKGPHGTVGPIGALQENAGLYDTVINPFHTEDLTQAGFDDVTEDNEHYEAIRFAYESGMITPKADGIFAPDDPATVRDYLGGLYLLLGGGTADAEACRDLLAGYGIVSAEEDLDAELTEEFLCRVLNAVAGQELMTTDTPDAVVKRGELADLYFQLNQ